MSPWPTALVVAASLLSGSSALAAGEVWLHEVSVEGDFRSSEDVLRKSLDVEIERAEKRTKLTKRAALSIIITRRTVSAGGVEVVVSAAVREAKSGSLLGTLSGRVASTTAPRSELDLVQRAASGAFAQLPAMLGARPAARIAAR